MASVILLYAAARLQYKYDLHQHPQDPGGLSEFSVSYHAEYFFLSPPPSSHHSSFVMLAIGV
jgi:hypothetical protein